MTLPGSCVCQCGLVPSSVPGLICVHERSPYPQRAACCSAASSLLRPCFRGWRSHSGALQAAAVAQ